MAAASDKQIKFIATLLDQVKEADPTLYATLRTDSLNRLRDSKNPVRSASSIIQDLLEVTKNLSRKAAATGREIVEGFYINGDSVARTVQSKTGNLYAKVFTLSTGKFEYEAGAISKIRKDEAWKLATLEDMMAFGVEFTYCGCCGRELTNPESIERGIGPICAAKYF